MLFKLYIITEETEETEEMSVDWKAFKKFENSRFCIYVEESDGEVLVLGQFSIDSNPEIIQEAYQRAINTYLNDFTCYGIGLGIVSLDGKMIRCSFVQLKDNTNSSLASKEFDIYNKTVICIYMEEEYGDILELEKFPINHNIQEIEDSYQKNINTYLPDKNSYGVGLALITADDEFVRCSFIQYK